MLWLTFDFRVADKWLTFLDYSATNILNKNNMLLNR